MSGHEDVTLRSFAIGDSARISEAWTKAAPMDGITEDRFRELILLDRNFDPSGLVVAEHEGRVVGSVQATRRRIAHDGSDTEPDTGWILYLFVTPQFRGQGLGRRLVTTAMTWLAEHGCEQVYFSNYTPNYFLPGLDAARYPAALQLFRSLGFEEVERPDAMDRTLIGYELPDDMRQLIDGLKDRGYTFRTPQADEIVPLAHLAGESFNSDWSRAIREGVVAGLPLERILVARDPEERLLGWAMHGTYENVIERFGPFGVLPESRGTGLGKALLHLTLERMTSLGAHSAWFLWADEGSAASSLYQKTGFRVTRTFTILRGSLTGLGQS